MWIVLNLSTSRRKPPKFPGMADDYFDLDLLTRLDRTAADDGGQDMRKARDRQYIDEDIDSRGRLTQIQDDGR